MPTGILKLSSLTCGQYINFPCVFEFQSCYHGTDLPQEGNNCKVGGFLVSYHDIVPADFKQQLDIICKDSII